MVRKSDGSLRFCVDYRQLNERTVKDSYLLDRIDVCLAALAGSTWFSTIDHRSGLNERTVKDSYLLDRIDVCVEALAGATWFSTFDLRSGYHPVQMDPRYSDKTTFMTRRGTCWFKVMPFGLCNAPTTIQRLMNVAMAGLDREICLIYLDDIIVHSWDLGFHLERLDRLFELLRRAGLKLKFSKRRLLQREVAFLGHRVNAEGLSTDPEKVEAIRGWPTPVCLREVRAFLGLCSYYCQFIPEFAEIVAPLHALTRKNRRFQWEEGCLESDEELKVQLTSSPVLALPRDDGDYIVDSDASDAAVGAVLSQVQDGEERPVVYFIRLYSRTDVNYCTTRERSY